MHDYPGLKKVTKLKFDDQNTKKANPSKKSEYNFINIKDIYTG